MSEREMDERLHGEETVVCAVCGTVNRASDHYCPECGAPLPRQASPADRETPAASLSRQPGESTPDASLTPATTEKESAAWIFGARPAAVVGGGLLLLLLAAALLAIGQRDDTGTIVMLSFCAAPLGVLVLLIGIARYIARAAGKGGERGALR